MSIIVNALNLVRQMIFNYSTAHKLIITRSTATSTELVEMNGGGGMEQA
ncbi:hypothetical protein ACNKHN_19210 [Shigella flexneri]